MSSTADRQALIASYLNPGNRRSRTSSDLAEQFQIWAADCQQLDPAEEARLLSEAIRQMSGRLVALHGGR